jgi:hypothetical protein
VMVLHFLPKSKMSSLLNGSGRLNEKNREIYYLRFRYIKRRCVIM